MGLEVALVGGLSDAWLALYHLGRLHAFEKAVVMLIAFGPFVVLGFVVYFVRRRDIREEEAEQFEVDLTGPTS